MPIDLGALVDPAHTALITQECQQGVVGGKSSLPQLAEAAAKVGMVENIARLAQAARAAGVLVVHCIAMRRPDGRGANRNARLFTFAARSPVQLLPDTEATELLPEIGLAESDLVIPRVHGLSPFHGTELDWILRNEGIRTIVGVGVSLNVAITNLTFDAVNAAYQVVIPRDAVAGFPAEYVEAVFENTLGAVATLVTAAELLAVWGG